ncbi:hypothetical protein SLEP1_g46795 [Rubroshorea leprosula]|uniref:AB hydrolase-1 domain-containing protein n=1 Tax=Rubroshorea leprosula TaxID=152421 RepID=A0AAV5LNE7_9ROSI|nr:hypothetical protein SLEP1_g46795 [Rubroshorea leprosula]
MASATNTNLAAASARAHTKTDKQNTSFKLPSGMFKEMVVVFFMVMLAWGYQDIRPPAPKKCGSPGGPPITAPRIKLRDGRYLAYKEHGVPRDVAKFKIVYVHGFSSSRHDAVVANYLSPEIFNELGIYIVSFDRPGYGESDPNPKRTVKSMALDIEELADQLGLGSKFYVIGFSMGGMGAWSCLKYIPHRLYGAALLAPTISYFWSGFPANVTKEALHQRLPQDRWAFRVAHYVPWLTYWWNTQKLFPPLSAIAGIPDIFSKQDLELVNKAAVNHSAYATQQGDYESLHRDLIVVSQSWGFNPTDLEKFPNVEGSVQLWQGDEDRFVPVTMQRYIVQKLPSIQYHELPGAGHMFPMAEGMSNSIIKALLIGKN